MYWIIPHIWKCQSPATFTLIYSKWKNTFTEYHHPRGSTSSACKVQIKLGCKPGCCPARGGLLTKCQGTTGHFRCVSNILEPNYTLQIFKSQGSTKMRGTHFLFTADGCRKNLLFVDPQVWDIPVPVLSWNLELRFESMITVIVGCKKWVTKPTQEPNSKWFIIRFVNSDPNSLTEKNTKPTRPVPSSYMRL